ncbi:hypothetical protein SLEP1_g25367 [Rubroshorea leprosula]|uniref:Uncharacterized protein n=1 Tax=Rubroshorea leprosula TaxID=152421 RepID=A0AAV5JU94_9ROSI|nr:hypothetical protein SLEP1_g25367 [Rubroshorea leprosula]
MGSNVPRRVGCERTQCVGSLDPKHGFHRTQHLGSNEPRRGFLIVIFDNKNNPPKNDPIGGGSSDGVVGRGIHQVLVVRRGTYRDDGGGDRVSGHGRFRYDGGSGGGRGKGVVYLSLSICFALDGEATWLSYFVKWLRRKGFGWFREDLGIVLSMVAKGWLASVTTFFR